MKLDQYVKQTFLDITNGVSAAKKNSSLGIAPGYVDGEKVFSAQLINFEIAVTVSKEGGGGIQVWSFGELNAKGSAEHVNRISFSVPIYFQAPTPQGGGE
jgi:Trypsin-co-occurring domain 2